MDQNQVQEIDNKDLLKEQQNHNKTESKIQSNNDTITDIKKHSHQFFGINKYLYIKHKNKQNQFNLKTYFISTSGTDFILLPRNPQFISTSQAPEPMFVPKQTILNDSIKRQVQRVCFAQTLINRIVYDSVDPSPYIKVFQIYQDIDPQSLGLDKLPYYIPQNNDDVTLVFQSRFQSGNLRRAIHLCEFEYNLILKTDYNTTCHTQWFYFSIANVRKDVQYRFSIVNMNKPDSLYNQGMKILCYSEKMAKHQRWHRSGHEICYYMNNMKKRNGLFYFSLTFAMKFHYDYDTIYMAHCYPYTYTQLLKYYRNIQNDPVKRNRVQKKLLCQTIAGNNCQYLIVSDFNNGKQKKGIFLTSRVHPGESMSSYIIENIIDFLIGNSQTARILRQNFIFKIVPMLNVDGVINGNYRCNLSAVDLNRQWIDPSKKYHPTIYFTKQLIKRMKEQRDLLIYCDFHGHSRKKNIFICNQFLKDGCSGKDPNKRQQIFPMLMKNNCNVFSHKDTSFALQRDRQGAARIALWKQFNIINCYTLQMSFCGADFGQRQYMHFYIDLYRQMANAFGQSILQLFDPDQLKVKQAVEELEKLKNDKNQINDKKRQFKLNSDDDSDYSNEDPNEQRNIDLIPGQKKNNQNIQFKSNSLNQNNDLVQRQLMIKKKINTSFPVKKKK